MPPSYRSPVIEFVNIRVEISQKEETGAQHFEYRELPLPIKFGRGENNDIVTQTDSTITVLEAGVSGDHALLDLNEHGGLRLQNTRGQNHVFLESGDETVELRMGQSLEALSDEQREFRLGSYVRIIVEVPKPAPQGEFMRDVWTELARRPVQTTVKRGTAITCLGSPLGELPGDEAIPEELSRKSLPDLALQALGDLAISMGCEMAPGSSGEIVRFALRIQQTLDAFSAGLMAQRGFQAVMEQQLSLDLEPPRGPAAERVAHTQTTEELTGVLLDFSANGPNTQAALVDELRDIPCHSAAFASATVNSLDKILEPLAPDTVGILGHLSGYRERYDKAQADAQRHLFGGSFAECYRTEFNEHRRKG